MCVKTEGGTGKIVRVGDLSKNKDTWDSGRARERGFEGTQMYFYTLTEQYNKNCVSRATSGGLRLNDETR